MPLPQSIEPFTDITASELADNFNYLNSFCETNKLNIATFAGRFDISAGHRHDSTTNSGRKIRHSDLEGINTGNPHPQYLSTGSLAQPTDIPTKVSPESPLVGTSLNAARADHRHDYHDSDKVPEFMTVCVGSRHLQSVTNKPIWYFRRAEYTGHDFVVNGIDGYLIGKSAATGLTMNLKRSVGPGIIGTCIWNAAATSGLPTTNPTYLRATLGNTEAIYLQLAVANTNALDANFNIAIHGVLSSTMTFPDVS